MTAAAQIAEQVPSIQVFYLPVSQPLNPSQNLHTGRSLSQNKFTLMESSTEEVRVIHENFDSFLSLLKFVPPWTDLLAEVRAYDRFNKIDVFFQNNPYSLAKTGINEAGGLTISIGTQALPKAWSFEQKRRSRLTNRGFFGHESGHCYITTRWEVRRAGLKIELPKKGEKGALEEHFCDVMAIACRHLSPDRGGEHPWAILYFEEEDEGGGAAAMDHPPSLEGERFLRAFNIRLLRRGKKGNYYDPHKMSDWPPFRNSRGRTTIWAVSTSDAAF